MHRNEHTRRHKLLDEALNTLVADFIEYSDIPPHLATVHHLLTWSKAQSKDADHPNTRGRHEAPNALADRREASASSDMLERATNEDGGNDGFHI